MNREELDGILRPTLGVLLTFPEVEELVQQFDLPPPLSVRPRNEFAEAGDGSGLSRAGIVVDGNLADWFPALWRTVATPSALLSLERRIGAEVFQWIFLIDEHTFAEQTETDNGFGWFFAPHASLLPRVLLAAGLLRPVDRALDAFGDAEGWELAFELTERGGSDRSRTLTLHVIGSNTTAVAVMVDQVAALLGVPDATPQ